MLNICALMGRLTANPELRHTPQGTAVATFTLAVDRSYARAGEEKQTDFIRIVAWRQTAEFVSKYFVKGQLVAVDGRIQTSSYTDKDGNKRTSTEVVAQNCHFAEKKSQNSGNFAPPADKFEDVTSFATGSASDFEEISSDDDLPF